MESPRQSIVIEAGRAEKQYWRDLYGYRELLYFLAWRDILVRYKQTVVGVVWSLIRPLLTMVVFVIVFGRIAKLGSGPLVVMAGMLPWQFFSNALTESGNSLVGNTNLITKIYFPRMVVPASSVVTSMVDFVISCFLMAALFLYYHTLPSSGCVLMPVFVLLAFAMALGVGLFASALMAQYRDFRFILPFVTQFGLYVSPVGFTSSHVPGKWRLLYSLNPMVGVIDGFRWSLLGGENTLYLPGLALSVGMTVLLLAGGIWYFRRVERTMADVI
jgi:lipopolysaccharide transport system permease protein